MLLRFACCTVASLGAICIGLQSGRSLHSLIGVIDHLPSLFRKRCLYPAFHLLRLQLYVEGEESECEAVAAALNAINYGASVINGIKCVR